MPRTKVLIVYSPTFARRMAVTVPDENDPLDWDERIVPLLIASEVALGKSVVTIPLGLYRQIGPDMALQQILGRPPVSDRHAVVDATGTVVDFIHIDSTLYPNWFRDGRTLKHDPNGIAKIGDLIHRLNL